MASNYIDTLHQCISYGNKIQTTHCFIEDQELSGKWVTLKGRKMVNFGSCSYLGLEYHPTLINACVDSAKKLGTQFSSSRTYASLGLYDQLEGHLREIFGKPSLVSSTTTLGHLSAIPVLVGDNDAVIMDMQVHSSIQMTAQMLKARGITMSIIRHNDMESLEKKIVEMKAKHDKVWYFADGVYSMYGDYAPFDELKRMLDTHKSFHLYIDDAHGASWAGENGEGVVRQHMEHHDKMVLTVSLNKSFASAGGAIIFPNEEMREKVLFCGGTMIFAGPIQPPLLGTAIASAKLHLSEEIKPLQDKLAGLVKYCNDALRAANIPQFQETDSPLFFIPVGLFNNAVKMIQRLHEEDLYVNTAAFPATPMKRGGIRFMITNHLDKGDIDNLVAMIVKHYANVLAEDGKTCKDVAKAFRIPEFDLKAPESTAKAQSEIVIESAKSISEMNQEEWDRTFANRGNINSRSLKMLEGVFSGNANPSENWNFHYFNVRDEKGNLILSTFFTDLITKDDMFASAAASEKAEDIRKIDPTYLTSRTVMLGSLITKANVLHLDRQHAQWKPALKALIEAMEKVQAATKANQLMIGEFLGERDEELTNFFLECGLSAMALPNSSLISQMGWTNHNEYVQSLNGRYRRDFKREILKLAQDFDVVIKKPVLQHEIDHCYQLYSDVFENSYEMNVHKLPRSFFEEAFRSPDYDVIQLHFQGVDKSENPVAFMLSHKDKGAYTALIVGLDYRFVRSHGTYKQILYRTVWRAWELGCQKIDLAYTAELVKKKVGAKPVPSYAFVQAADHFSMAQLSVM